MARRIQALTVDDVLAQLGSDDDGIDWNDSDDDEEEAEDRTFLETSDPLSLAQMSSDLQEDAGDNTLTDIDNTELQVHGSPPFTDTNTSTTQPTATSTQPPTTSTQSLTISTQLPTISTQLTATSIQPPTISTHPTTTSTQVTATTNRIPTQPRLSTATTETHSPQQRFLHAFSRACWSKSIFG